MMTNLLIPLLKEEFRVYPGPLSGSRAYLHCRHPLGHAYCGCQHHGIMCRLNRTVNWFGELHNMARKKQSPSSWTQTTFVRCELNAEEKTAFRNWVSVKGYSPDGYVIEALQSNHKISLSYNEQSDSFICSITGKAEDCVNASKCMTSHAKDFATALSVTLYKHAVLFKAGVWEELDTGEDFG